MKNLFHKDVILSTIFVFVVIYLLKIVAFNIQIFDPLKESLRDFELTDIIFSRFHHQENVAVDTNIFLANIGNNNRIEIAEQIRVIRAHNPKVIGLDVTFPFAKNGFEDSVLASVLKNTPQLIGASYFDYKDPKTDEADNLVSSISLFNLTNREGFVNFRTIETESTIRTYSPMIEYEKRKHYSFSSQIVRKYDSEKYDYLLDRNRPVEIINYKGNIRGDSAKFIAFDFNEINDSNKALKQINNKIVLMGFMGPDLKVPVIEDNHFTPLNKVYSGRSRPDMYGVVIHANILAMILDNNYINQLNKYLLWVITFILCYLHMYFFIVYSLKRYIWFPIFAKVVQFLSSVIIVFVALLLFKYCNIKLSTTIIILPIVLSVDLMNFYEAIVMSLNKHFGYNTIFVNGQ